MDKSKLAKVFKDLKITFNKQEECKRRGHAGEIVNSVYTHGFLVKASCYCIECGDTYSRRATPSETMSLNVRVTI